MLNKLLVISICVTLIFVFACSSEDDSMSGTNPDLVADCKDVMVSYRDDIVPIVNNSCALSGCHVAGFSSGDYTTYDGLKGKADGGSLNTRVVINKDMPPSDSSGPKSLTTAQINAFKCWIAAGAPDN